MLAMSAADGVWILFERSIFGYKQGSIMQLLIFWTAPLFRGVTTDFLGGLLLDKSGDN